MSVSPGHKWTVVEGWLQYRFDVSRTINTHATACWSNVRAVNFGSEVDHGFMNQATKNRIFSCLARCAKPSLVAKKVETFIEGRVLLIGALAVLLACLAQTFYGCPSHPFLKLGCVSVGTTVLVPEPQRGIDS